MATKEQINDLIDTLNDESYMDGYHQGFDEAWDESRNKGFDEGFEEADEQNANKIIELQEELDMMHEQIETSYNEGFEDGEDEERAIHERLLWEEINDAIPQAYAEGQTNCDCSKSETWISYEGRSPDSAYRFSTTSKASKEVKDIRAMVKAHNANPHRYGSKKRVMMAGRGPRGAYLPNGRYCGNFYASWLPEKSGNVTHWDVYIYDISPPWVPSWKNHVVL